MGKIIKKISKMNKGELIIKVMAFVLAILMVLTGCITLIYYIFN